MSTHPHRKRTPRGALLLFPLSLSRRRQVLLFLLATRQKVCYNKTGKAVEILSVLGEKICHYKSFDKT